MGATAIQTPSKCTSALCSVPCFVTRIYLHTLRKINSRNLLIMKPRLTVLFFWNPKSGWAHFGFLIFTFVSRKCYLKMITWHYYPLYTTLEARLPPSIPAGDTFSKLALDLTQPATVLKWDAQRCLWNCGFQVNITSVSDRMCSTLSKTQVQNEWPLLCCGHMLCLRNENA